MKHSLLGVVLWRLWSGGAIFMARLTEGVNIVKYEVTTSKVGSVH